MKTVKESLIKLVIDQDRRIFLRELDVKDVSPEYYNWMHDPEVTRYLECRFSDNTMDAIRAFVVDNCADPDALLLGICVKDGDRHIGNIKLHRINRVHRFAEVSIMIGDKDCWGRGYGQDAIELLANYAFTVLGLNKLTAECYANNLGSCKVFQKAGFKIEGQRQKQYLYDNQYVDAYMLGLTRPEGLKEEERNKP